MSELTRDDLVRWLQSALRANEHDWTNEADRDKESARLQSIFDLALSALTARSEGFREGVEAAARVCDEGVKWEPNFPPNVQRVTNETTCLLAKAIRALSPRETDADAQIPHGVCRADDPNREAKGIGSGASAAHRPSAIGVAPSVSDDSAGTRISVASAPSCRLPKGCEAPEMCEELNRCTAKAQPSAPSSEVAEMVGILTKVGRRGYTIVGEPNAAILMLEAAALLSKVGQGDKGKWAVFCALCGDRWSVSHPHPGKSICTDCEYKYKPLPPPPERP